MSRNPRARPLVENVAVIAAGVGAIYFALVPLGGPGGLPAPDLLYCVLAVWVIRRPLQASVWLVLGLGLFGDLMLSRPVGLGALGLLLATEALRANAGLLQGASFALEWLAAAAGFAAILAGMRLVMEFAFLDGPGLDIGLRYLASTMLAYPLVAAVLHWGVGLRAPRAAIAHGLGRLR